MNDDTLTEYVRAQLRAAFPLEAVRLVVPTTRRRTRAFAVASAVLVTVLVVVLVLVLADKARQSAGPVGPAVKPTTTVPTQRVPTPAGATDVEYRTPSWYDGPYTGGAPFPGRPTCGTAQLTATATTRATVGGVLGLIHVTGRLLASRRDDGERCVIPISHGPTGLRAEDGERLDVALTEPSAVTQLANPRSDVPPESGEAIWGFAWLGSYCGPAAASIEVPRGHGQTPLTIPLSGPQPSCANGTLPKATLLDGPDGLPGDPVQPARPEYAQLRLTGHIGAGTTRTLLAPIHLTLSTAGDTPITLDPCPKVTGRDDVTGKGGFSDPIVSGYPPCTDHASVVAPGHPLHFTLISTSLAQSLDSHGARPGSVVHVRLGLAGATPIELSTTVDR